MYGQTKLTRTEIIWQAAIFCSVMFTAIEASFTYAFEIRLHYWQVFIDLTMSTIFIVDIFQSHRRKKSTKKTGLSKEYSKQQLVIDILASIPFNIISLVFGFGQIIQLFRFIRLLRLGRITKIFSMVGNLTIVPGLVKIPAIVISSIVAIHWIACGWVIVHPISEPNLYTYYNKALYWAITTLTTIGYGDITPTDNISRIYTMIIMILGVGVYGIVIGNVTRMISMADRYKEKSKEKINDLNIFMKHYNIPHKLQNAVFGFYNHLLTKRLSDNDAQIISELPQPLQIELQCYMNMKLIGNVPLFMGCSHNCLKEVAMALEQMFFPPGKSIIKAGDVGEEMFIIGHGIVDVVIKDKGVVATLREGQFFGETALLQEVVRNADVNAQTYCDLYKLSKESFLDVIKKYPELLKNMENILKKRSTDK